MKKEQTTEKGKPYQKFKAGGVTATIWENKQEKEGKTFSTFNTVIAKSYKDKEGQWQNTDSYNNAKEIAQLRIVLAKAEEFLLLNEE